MRILRAVGNVRAMSAASNRSAHCDDSEQNEESEYNCKNDVSGRAEARRCQRTRMTPSYECHFKDVTVNILKEEELIRAGYNEKRQKSSAIST